MNSFTKYKFDGKKVLKVLKFEMKNVLRSRWIFGYGILGLFISGGLNYLSNDPVKTLVSLGLVIPVLVPLVTLVYTTLHWYYNEKFTVLLLTQPLDRNTFVVSRYIALVVALAISLIIGMTLPFVVAPAAFGVGMALILAMISILTMIFVGLALVLSIFFEDRLQGIGAALGLWAYFTIVHDGLTLLGLVIWREEPLDIVAGIIVALNPVSLSRVVPLMYFEQPLLLGHTGALTREILTSWKGAAVAGGSAGLWMVLPVIFVLFRFPKKDL